MRRLGLSIGLAVLMVVAAACKKNVDKPPVPPPVTDGGPTNTGGGPSPTLTDPTPRIASFTAEPARVDRGQSVTLRWATTGANEVLLDQGLGAVAANGTRQVSPSATTTYVLLARSGGNTDTRSVTVEVVTPPIPIPQAPKQPGGGDTFGGLVNQLQDVFFDYDMSDMRDDSRRVISMDADILKRAFGLDPRANVVIEGHADERGSAEYNLGLADRRAVVVRDQLIQLGVPANRLRTISFGEENPVCRDQTDACWQRNRRAHFVPAQ